MLIMGLTFKNVLKAVSSGSTQTIFETVPDEYLAQVKTWISEIERTVDEIRTQVLTIFEGAPRQSRREYALWVNANHPALAPYLFTLFDGREIEPLIYKTADWHRGDTEEVEN